MYKAQISVVKTIQIRTEELDESGKVLYGWNKRFRSPKAAAEQWADIRIREWEDKKFGGYRHMTDADEKYRHQLKKRLIRMATAKFKGLLK